MHPRARRSLQRILSAGERRRRDVLSIRAGDPLADRFASFGEKAYISAPWRQLGNTASIAVGAGTLIREGVLFEALAPPGTVIIDIGSRCHLSTNVRIVAVNGVILEDDVAIADNVFLADTIHDYRELDPGTPAWNAQLKLGEPMRIRHGAWIGVNCVVTGGVEIGENAIVAPCTVVNRDVPPNALVVGNPFRVQRVRRPDGGWDWVDETGGAPSPGNSAPGWSGT